MPASLDTLRQWFLNSEDLTEDSRTVGEMARDYYDGEQLTVEEHEALKARGQPTVVFNRVKPKVDFLLGLETQNRTDPKAYPRTPQHEQSANAATDAIRYVCENNDWNSLRSEVFENLTIEGAGGVDVTVIQKRDRLEIVMHQVFWDRFFYDASSRRRDFTDARYFGTLQWMDAKRVEELWPGSKDKITATMDDSTGSDTYDDIPRRMMADINADRVRVFRTHYREGGKWWSVTWLSGGKLDKDRPSPFLDEDGESEPSLIAVSAHVDRDGNRYGSVKQLFGPQDEINKRRSRGLHHAISRQTQGERGAIDDIEEMKRELSKPDGHVERNPGKEFGLLDTTDMQQAHLLLLQEAKEEIDAVGANAALSGKGGGDPSGRAILAKQQGGVTELGKVFDVHRQWSKRVYRAIWNRIRQFWTEERWIRVTDDEKNVRFVGINRQVLAQEDPEIQAAVEMGLISQEDPRLGVAVSVENDVAELDVDIMIEDAPDTINTQLEEFEFITRLYEANPNAIPFDVVVEAAPFRSKDKILERLRGNDEAQAQALEQAQQAAALEQQAKQAEVQKDEAEAFKDQAAGVKTLAEVGISPEALLQ